MFDANLTYLPPGSRFFARITSLDTKHPLFEAGFRNNALVFGVKPRSQTASDPLDFHGGTVELTAPDGKVISVQDDSECFSPLIEFQRIEPTTVEMFDREMRWPPGSWNNPVK